jgi:hypothetical protein
VNQDLVSATMQNEGETAQSLAAIQLTQNGSSSLIENDSLSQAVAASDASNTTGVMDSVARADLVSGAQMGKWSKTMTNYKMSDARLQGMNALTSIFNGLNSHSDKGVALGVFNLVSSGIKLIETQTNQYKLDDNIDQALGIYGYTQTAAALHDAFAKYSLS